LQDNEDEHSDDEDDEIDNKSDDDDFIDELKKAHNHTNIDMDKLTKRQKTAFL